MSQYKAVISSVVSRASGLVLIAVFTTCSAIGAEQTKTDVIYDFKDRWRFGAPSFAYEYFPNFDQQTPVLFSGEMAPKGIVILRSPKSQLPRVAAVVPAEPPSVTVKAADVDITPLVSVVGAQHFSPSGKVNWVASADLPPLSVEYEPELPPEIRFPGTGNCVLLWKLGESSTVEWTPGRWTVTLRFDSSSLDVRLFPGGTGGFDDPADSSGSKVLHEIEFVVKRVESNADRDNLAYFRFLEALSSVEPNVRQTTAIPILSRLIQSYPTDGPLLDWRAKLLAEAGRYSEAVADGETLIGYMQSGTLTRPVPGPRGIRMDRSSVIDYLRARNRNWEQLGSRTP